jgi:hypothetical protein
MKQLKQLLPLLVFLLCVCFEAATTAAATAMMLNFADSLLVKHDPCTHNEIHVGALSFFRKEKRLKKTI